MKTKTNLIIKILTTLIIYLILPIKITKASEEINFQITPMILQVEIESGTSISYEYKVSGLKGTTFQILAKEFTPKDNSGNLETIETSPEILEWISFEPKTITINEDNKIQNFKLNISIPKDIEPQDIYFVVCIESINQKEIDSGNKINGEIQSPVLLTIDNLQNPSIKSGEINYFKTKFFNLFNNINFDLIIENTGNIRFKSYGNIEITNLITKEINEIKLLPENILAKSSRKIRNNQKDKNNISWKAPSLIGIYKADVSITDNNQSIIDSNLSKETIYFIYINIYLLISCLLLIITIPSIIYIKTHKSLTKNNI